MGKQSRKRVLNENDPLNIDYEEQAKRKRTLRQSPAPRQPSDEVVLGGALQYGPKGTLSEAAALRKALAESAAAAAAAAAAELPETIDLTETETVEEEVACAGGGAEEEAGGAALVGARVKVYWTGVCKWFTGRVKVYDAALRSYYIHYADGDRKWHELDQPGEVWRLAPAPAPARGGIAGRRQGQTGVRLLGGAAPVPPVPRAPPAPPVALVCQGASARGRAPKRKAPERKAPERKAPEREAPEREARCASPSCVAVHDLDRKVLDDVERRVLADLAWSEVWHESSTPEVTNPNPNPNPKPSPNPSPSPNPNPNPSPNPNPNPNPNP